MASVKEGEEHRSVPIQREETKHTPEWELSSSSSSCGKRKTLGNLRNSLAKRIMRHKSCPLIVRSLAQEVTPLGKDPPVPGTVINGPNTTGLCGLERVCTVGFHS